MPFGFEPIPSTSRALSSPLPAHMGPHVWQTSPFNHAPGWATCGINDVPDEVLTNIFMAVKDEACPPSDEDQPELHIETPTSYSPSPPDVLGWSVVTGVCRRWRKVATDNWACALWVDVHVTEHLQWLELCFARSGTRNLNLTVVYSSDSHFSRVTGMLAMHPNCVESISLYNLPPAPQCIYWMLPPLLHSQQRSLADLRISTEFGQYESSADDGRLTREMLSPDVLPALRSLRLKNTFMDWDSSVLPRLHTLIYAKDDFSDDGRVNLGMLLGLLKECPSLERLHTRVVFSGFGGGYGGIQFPAASVPLPRLKALHISVAPDDGSYIAQKLLAALRLPASTDIEIALEASDGDLATLIPDDPVALPHLRDATWASIGTFAFACGTRAPDAGPGTQGRLKVSFEVFDKALWIDSAEREDWEFSREWVRQGVALLKHARGLRALELRMTDVDDEPPVPEEGEFMLDGETCRELCAAFPAVEELCVRGFGVVRELLVALGWGLVRPLDGVGKWEPMPRLRVFEISTVDDERFVRYDTTCLVACLTSRVASGAAPLEELVFLREVRSGPVGEKSFEAEPELSSGHVRRLLGRAVRGKMKFERVRPKKYAFWSGKY